MTRNIITPLTPEDRYRLATRFNLQPPPQPVLVVSTDQERPTTSVPDFDDHVHAIAGDPATMPPGMPVNIARRSARRRQAIAEWCGYVALGLGAITLLAALIWFAGVLLRAVAVP